MNVSAPRGSLQVEGRPTGESPLTQALLYTSGEYFTAELQTLAATCWQFFCTTDDVANANDWVARRVFGVEVFVQNFVGNLRGYHNVCQHRGYPLRTERRGNGTVKCGFHGWAYNPDGVPVSIPHNKDLFGFSREQQVALAIPEVRVAVVGRLVFVALADTVPPIEQFLGRHHALFLAVSNRMRNPRHRWTGTTRANWKLCFEVTLDDYHVSFVHPTTLGAELVPAAHLVYERNGHHSHVFGRRDAHWQFTSFWPNVECGDYDFSGYKGHQTFPNMMMVGGTRMVLLSLFSPVGPAETEVDDIVFDVEGDAVDEPHWQAHNAAFRVIASEDQLTVETQQKAIGQLARRPTYGVMEERVAWFRESYDALVGAEARRRLER